MPFQHLKPSRNVGDNEYTSNIYKTEFDKNNHDDIIRVSLLQFHRDLIDL